MQRVYKEDHPRNTVLRIKNILTRLGVVTTEAVWMKYVENVYSVRVETLEDNGSFGSNGKGKTRFFTLASAYAEFMERIQNCMIILSNSFWNHSLEEIKQNSGFYYFPDEKIMDINELEQLPSKVLIDLFSQEKFDKSIRLDTYNTIGVPFYDYFSNQKVYLPLKYLLSATGTNGMAAGNTNFEAIYQGVCEILERYAAHLVFSKQLTPPTISEEILKKYPDEKKIIEDIEEKGYKVIVKDFSCGLSLPVLGTIILNQQEDSYRLNVGSDTSFSIALSRTLTEILQGIDSSERLETFFQPIPEEEFEYFQKDDEFSIKIRHRELNKFFVNGKGKFPKSIFANKESYSFNETTFITHDSYKSEVEYLFAMMHAWGSDIYVRNVSFLGFPTYYIYVTNVSVAGQKVVGQENCTDKLPQEDLERILFPLTTFFSDINRVKDFTDIIEKNQCDLSDISFSSFLKLEFTPGFYFNNIPSSFFLSLLHLRARNYQSAISYFQMFIDATDNNDNTYFKEVKRYFEYLAFSDENELPNDFSQEIKDYYNPEFVLEHFDLPVCPACHECTFVEKCITKGSLDFVKTINRQSIKTIINQDLI